MSRRRAIIIDQNLFTDRHHELNFPSPYCSPPIMHFNLTSTNVILDEHFEAKISDYGFRRFLPIQNKYISSRIYHETLAYVAPELACGSLRVSEKCDVYSFGVVLLELVTGRRPSEVINGATALLGDFVRSKLEQERPLDCIDLRLSGYIESRVIDVLKLALICTFQVCDSYDGGFNCSFVFVFLASQVRNVVQ